MDQRWRIPRLRLRRPLPHGLSGRRSRRGGGQRELRSGFEGLAHIDSAPNNRALLDQLAALSWVQDNIARFGGDPGNLTVLGQSAGAGSIAALLTMPVATGTFRRAILQSIPQTYFTTSLAAEISAEICDVLGRTSTVADLADIAPDDLVRASRTASSRLPQRLDRWGPVAYAFTPFAPVVDGDVLNSAPWVALADRLPGIDDAQVDVLIDGLSPTPGAHRYRAAYPSATPHRLRETALSDWLYRMPALQLAEAADLGGARVWLYELCWGFGPHRASHGLDTLLLFGTADVDGEVTTAGPAAVAATEQLSQLIRAEHLAFATMSDPGWPRYRTPQRMTRVYDPEPVLVAYPEERSRALWRHQRFGVLDATTLTT